MSFHNACCGFSSTFTSADNTYVLFITNPVSEKETTAFHKTRPTAKTKFKRNSFFPSVNIIWADKNEKAVLFLN